VKKHAFVLKFELESNGCSTSYAHTTACFESVQCLVRIFEKTCGNYRRKPVIPLQEQGMVRMSGALNAEQSIEILRDTVVALVRRDGPDLSARQLGVFLICYLDEGAHTVRGLAAALNVSKPAITRALDRLGELDLARRKVDPMDRRSVLVQRTLKGSAFLRDLRGIMADAIAGKKDVAQPALVA
jgi:DNA-binding MarR family transcriptional regulator